MLASIASQSAQLILAGVCLFGAWKLRVIPLYSLPLLGIGILSTFTGVLGFVHVGDVTEVIHLRQPAFASERLLLSAVIITLIRRNVRLSGAVRNE